MHAMHPLQFEYFLATTISTNTDKSAARFCHQVAAWVPDMLCNFYLAKNHKITNNSTTIKAIEKINTDLEFLEFKKILI